MKQSTVRKINGLFGEWSGKNTPGFAVGIFQQGKILFSCGYGMASLEHSVPIDPKTIFDLGSTSKQFVAFCIALLERSGKLSLEDDVRKYIPEMTRYGTRVRIRHLLHHTSGMRDYLALMELAGMRYENEYPDKQILGMITRQRNLNFTPGAEFLYSNSGYLLLGEIVKRVSGRSLREFAAENIFSPLGMCRTHFHDDYTRIVQGKASGYSVAESGFKVDISLFDVVGDGGVNTCVEDLAKWDANFYRNRLPGGQELIKKITTPGRLNDGRALEYACGLFVSSYRGQKVVSHGGSWVGYRSELMRFPEQGLTIACLSNLVQTNPTHIAKRIADICLEDDLSGPPTPAKACVASKKPTARLIVPEVGVYLNENGNGFIEIESSDGKYILRDDESRYDLYFLEGDRYTVASGSRDILIRKGANGKSVIILKKLNAEPVEYHKTQVPRAHRKDLMGFAGRYYSEELGVEYTAEVKGDVIFLDRPGAETENLHRISDAVFAGKYISMRSDPKAGGKRLLLDYCRIRGIILNKIPNDPHSRTI